MSGPLPDHFNEEEQQAFGEGNEFAFIDGIKQNHTFLLIGETGVGKSTFINAFANYLKFQSLDEAAAQPKLECYISTYFHAFNTPVRAKGINPKNGTLETDDDQCSTQMPSTYEFKISDWTIRFIDTPGIHDVRGLDHDMINYLQVSSYLRLYERLTGIIVLLKPNEQRLTDDFKSLLKAIFNYFNKEAIDNMVFCFTFADRMATKHRFCETKSTVMSYFGEAGLKDRFKDEQFYFVDNVAFKYLCEKFSPQKYGYYDDEDKNTFQLSWNRSKKELGDMMNHFLKLPKSYICAKPVQDYENLLEWLTISVDLVVITIQENIERSNIEKNSLMKFGDKVGKDGLKENKVKLEIENIEIHPVEYPYPRLVCKSEKCQDLYSFQASDRSNESSRNNERGNRSHCSYEMHPVSGTDFGMFVCKVCHSSQCQDPKSEKEYCIEAYNEATWEKFKFFFRRIGTECNFVLKDEGEREGLLRKCQAKSGCGCKYKDHTIDTYKIQRHVIKVEIESRHKHVEGLRKVMATMFTNMAKLSKIVQHSCWFFSEDPLEKKLSLRAKEEAEKNKLLTEADSKSSFVTILNLYKKCRDAVKNEPATENIEVLRDIICNLPTYGIMVLKILEAEQKKYANLTKIAKEVQTELEIDENNWRAFFSWVKKAKAISSGVFNV